MKQVYLLHATNEDGASIVLNAFESRDAAIAKRNCLNSSIDEDSCSPARLLDISVHVTCVSVMPDYSKPR